jgi:hypothetical protein
MLPQSMRIPNVVHHRKLPCASDIKPKSPPERTSKPSLFQGLEAGKSKNSKEQDFDSVDTSTEPFFTSDSEDCLSSSPTNTTDFEDYSEAEGTLSDDEEDIEHDQTSRTSNPITDCVFNSPTITKLDQEPSTTLSKVKNKIEYLKLLPNEVLLEPLYNCLDKKSRYHLTTACDLFLTHRDKAVEEYRKQEARDKVEKLLNDLSENLNLLEKKEVRDKLVKGFSLLDKTYTPTGHKEERYTEKKGNQFAIVNFNAKTILVALKLLMHNDENYFYKRVFIRNIVGKISNSGKPDVFTIQYIYSRIFWALLDYGVFMNYEDQGMGFVIGDYSVGSDSKFTQITKSFFNGITDKDLIHFVKIELFDALEEKIKLEKWEKTYSYRFFRSIGCVVS